MNNYLMTIPEGATGKEIAEILEGDKKVTLTMT